MAVLSLADKTGTFYNIGTASTDASHSVTGAVAGGNATIEVNRTGEPTVSISGGVATKIAGVNWEDATKKYLNVYSLDGVNVLYFFTDELSGMKPFSFIGTGATINLSYVVGALYNMSSASAATNFALVSEVAGGMAVIFSRSTTTEPTVTPSTGTATKLQGATWVADTDMYLNVYSLDGTNVFYYWTNATGSVDNIDRLEEDTAVTTTKDIDWSLYEIFKYTLTGAVTLSDVNLPTSGGKTITLMVTGDFAITYPTGWNTTFVNGTYDGTVLNQIVVQYVKSATPYYVLQISQPV